MHSLNAASGYNHRILGAPPPECSANYYYNEENEKKATKKHVAAANFSTAHRDTAGWAVKTDGKSEDGPGSFSGSYSSFGSGAGATRGGGGVGWASPHMSRSGKVKVAEGQTQEAALAAQLHPGKSPAALAKVEKALEQRNGRLRTLVKAAQIKEQAKRELGRSDSERSSRIASRSASRSTTPVSSRTASRTTSRNNTPSPSPIPNRHQSSTSFSPSTIEMKLRQAQARDQSHSPAQSRPGAAIPVTSAADSPLQSPHSSPQMRRPPSSSSSSKKVSAFSEQSPLPTRPSGPGPPAEVENPETSQIPRRKSRVSTIHESPPQSPRFSPAQPPALAPPPDESSPSADESSPSGITSPLGVTSHPDASPDVSDKPSAPSQAHEQKQRAPPSAPPQNRRASWESTLMQRGAAVAAGQAYSQAARGAELAAEKAKRSAKVAEKAKAAAEAAAAAALAAEELAAAEAAMDYVDAPSGGARGLGATPGAVAAEEEDLVTAAARVQAVQRGRLARKHAKGDNEYTMATSSDTEGAEAYLASLRAKYAGGAAEDDVPSFYNNNDDSTHKKKKDAAYLSSLQAEYGYQTDDVPARVPATPDTQDVLAGEAAGEASPPPPGLLAGEHVEGLSYSGQAPRYAPHEGYAPHGGVHEQQYPHHQQYPKRLHYPPHFSRRSASESYALKQMQAGLAIELAAKRSPPRLRGRGMRASSSAGMLRPPSAGQIRMQGTARGGLGGGARGSSLRPPQMRTSPSLDPELFYGLHPVHDPNDPRTLHHQQMIRQQQQLVQLQRAPPDPALFPHPLAHGGGAAVAGCDGSSATTPLGFNPFGLASIYAAEMSYRLAGTYANSQSVPYWLTSEQMKRSAQQLRDNWPVVTALLSREERGLVHMQQLGQAQGADGGAERRQAWG